MKFSGYTGFYLFTVILLLSGLLVACGDSATPPPPTPTANPAVANVSTTTVVTGNTTAASVTSVAPATTGNPSTSAPVTTAQTTTAAIANTTVPATTAPATTTPAATAAVSTTAASTTTAPTTKAAATVTALKPSVLLEPMTWQSQTWNNCAPMSALMALSYYGIKLNQAQCGLALRPNGGDKNSPVGDKHVEPGELANFIRSQGLKVMIREDGNFDKLRALLSAGIPVITQQWLHLNDDIAHYRVARGYNLANNTIIFNDSMDTGPQTVAGLTLQDKLWKAYDHRYLPVYQASQEATVKAILGDDADYAANAARALAVAEQFTQANPSDIDGWRNLGYLRQDQGDCKGALAVWEQHIVRGLAPSDNGPYNRFLWYQLWPVECYNKVGNYQQVIKIAPNEINRAGIYAEARYQYAFALSNVGRRDEAIAQLKKSILDDQNYKPSVALLEKLGAS